MEAVLSCTKAQNSMTLGLNRVLTIEGFHHVHHFHVTGIACHRTTALPDANNLDLYVRHTMWEVVRMWLLHGSQALTALGT